MPTPNIAGLTPGNMSIYGYPNASASVSIHGSGYTVYAGPGSIPGSGYIFYSGVGSIPGVGPDRFTGPIAPSGPCNDAAQIAQLEALIAALYELIATLFPPSKAMSAFIAQYTAPARLNPFTYIRFAWIKANPGQKLYPSEEAALAIKDLYLANGMDWTSDPLILRYFPPAPPV